jgi:pimeloyl-ACP methyl ester carboxylesterase
VPFHRRPDGCRLYYEVHGLEGGQPLLLLEGMGGDIPGWRRNIPRLAERMWVVAYDFRGNGRSDPPEEGLSMDTLQEDTLGLLDHLEVDAAHVYGQSMGGLVAQQMALDHPARVRSLILGCTYPGRKHQIPIRAKVPKDRPWLALYAPRFAEQHPDHIEEDLRIGARQAQSAVGRLRQWEAIRDFDPFDRLPEIRVPTLVLHGTEDRLVHPDNARVVAERIPGARLRLLEGAGHVYHSEQPEEADRAVLDFIRSL